MNGNFVLTVTRVSEESQTDRTVSKKVKIKRISSQPSKFLSTYAFDTFDEFCEFCIYLNTCHGNAFNKKLKNSKLYLYHNKYYLVLHNVVLAIKDFKSFHYLITEFATYVKDSELFERKLSEHAKGIIPTNAISTCIKHFT